MKKLLFTACFISIAIVSYSQGVSVNENGLPADPSAMLDVSSYTKGVLIPRLRTIERIAIVGPANGLIVYDIDTQSFWYCSYGTWKEILNDGDAFTLPYDGTADDPGKVFSITNTNAGISTAIYGRRMGGSGLGLSVSNGLWGDNSDGNGVAGTSNTNSGVAGFSNTGIGVSATSISGPAVSSVSTSGFGISSTSQSNFGIASLSNGIDKAGVLGVNTNNTGVGYGVIGSIENPTGGAGVFGKNNAAAGHAGLFTSVNASNTDPALKVTTSGNGAAAYFNTTGLGAAGYFVHNNVANLNPAIFISNSSNGNGITVSQSAANTAHGIQILHNGSGKGVFSTSVLGQAGLFEITGATNTNTTLKSSTLGTGMAGLFEITNNTNTNTTLKSSTVGTGIAGLFEITNVTNDNTSLKASTLGTGLAGTFVKNNTTGSISDVHDPAVLIDNNSKGNALKVISLHAPSVNSGIDVQYDGQTFGLNVNSTHGGIHAISTSSTFWSILAENYSGGGAIKGVASNFSVPAIKGEHTTSGGIGVLGTGVGETGVGVKGTNASNNYEIGAVTGINNSTTVGVGVYGKSTGSQGVGVYGTTTSESNAAVLGENEGGGEGVSGYSVGPYAIGVGGIAESDAGTYGFGILGNNWGDGDGVRGFAGNGGYGVSGHDNSAATGGAGLFSIFYTTNTHTALKVENAGLGASLNVVATNASNNGTMAKFTKSGTGDYAVFEEGNGTNEIRFDNNGKGFFNGGTQTGGADIAEAFDVYDDIANYEPGDVLIISIEKDRTVVKSDGAYSNLVAGVYATKPGVLMTEENIDADLSGQVPMGVVGVIPTKVCLEGGAITRGDMLVTSSIPGVAMKADTDKVKPGQVIGKALENYSADNTGKIRVLVNVK